MQRREVHRPVLMQYPLFKNHPGLSKAGFVAICHLAIEGRFCETGEVIFIELEVATVTILVTQGHLQYYLSQEKQCTRLWPACHAGEPGAYADAPREVCGSRRSARSSRVPWLQATILATIYERPAEWKVARAPSRSFPS